MRGLKDETLNNRCASPVDHHGVLLVVKAMIHESTQGDE
jgi:hypothetical protein